MYENYVISFLNRETNEIREYYVYYCREELEDKARELRNKFYDKDDIIDIQIYKFVKQIRDDKEWYCENN